MSTENNLNYADYAAIALYFLAVIGTGLYSMWRANRSTVTGYFLAGRFMHFIPVGASLFASNIGSEHFVGLAGSGAATGIGIAAYEYDAIILLQLLGWIFLPVYIASGVCTLPEYMKRRYGGERIRIYLACLSLFMYIFTKISVNLYAGALFIQQALNWNIYISVALILAITAFCTITGGLTAVIYTDTLQAFIMICGGITLSIISFIKIGGYGELHKRFINAVPNTTNNFQTYSNTSACGLPPKNSWIMLRPPNDPVLPWPGFFFGQITASLWYWCADQNMVQRALAAKNLSHAQAATIMTGWLKLLPIFIMVFPGMISRVLFTDEVGCNTEEDCLRVCGNKVSCTNIAYPKLVLGLMPSFLKGVMLSVMLAALMSDLTSLFNSASSLFTLDIYNIIRKRASRRELMIVGRVFVCFMIVISVVWIPVIETVQEGQLFVYIQAIQGYFGPTISAVYLLSILSTHTNETAAFYGLIIGCIFGLSRMILTFSFGQIQCGQPDNRPLFVRLHYMYFAVILFWFSIFITLVITYMTKRQDKKFLVKTTFWTRFNKQIGDSQDKVEMLSLENKIIAEQPKENTITDEINASENETFCLKKVWNWFCGLDSKSTVSELNTKIRLDKITSLQQKQSEKWAIFANTIILICITLFLYVFFTCDHFGLLA